jgi:hypothetical protein
MNNWGDMFEFKLEKILRKVYELPVKEIGEILEAFEGLVDAAKNGGGKQNDQRRKG